MQLKVLIDVLLLLLIGLNQVHTPTLQSIPIGHVY